jgi:hypothetical protein
MKKEAQAEGKALKARNFPKASGYTLFGGFIRMLEGDQS